MEKRGILIIFIFILPILIFSHLNEGDGGQLFAYWAFLPPSPIEGNIAPDGNEDKWQDAYVRSVIFTDGAGTNKEGTVFICNDSNYLYIGISFNSTSVGDVNYAAIYFDINHNQSLEGDTITPGEYYVKVQGSDSTVIEDGGWYGSNGWQAYSSLHPNLEVAALRHGTGSPNTWNFEFKIPLKGGTGINGESYLNVESYDELGICIEVNDAADGVLYWSSTNLDINDASGWGDLKLGLQTPERILSAPYSMIVPTVDGDILNDENWNHYTTSKRSIILADYNGNILNGELYTKTVDFDAATSGDEFLYLGLIIYGIAQNTDDSVFIFNDYNFGSSDLDYILTDNEENGAISIYTGIDTGDSEDIHFSATIPGWTADGTFDGDYAIGYNGTDYECEMAIPLVGSSSQDLIVDARSKIGFNLEFIQSSTGNSYWWTHSTNSQYQKVRLDAAAFTALGWAQIQLSSAVIQPIFPADNDTVSGHYPFTIWAEAAGNPDLIIYAEFSDDSGKTWQILERADGTGFWTATWNTTTLLNGQREIRIRVLDADTLEANAIINVYVDNTEKDENVSSIVINSPDASSTISGITTIQWTTNPFGTAAIVADSVQIDGGPWYAATIQPPSSGGSGYFDWNTHNYKNGSHIFRIKSVDNQGFVAYSDYRLVFVENKGPVVQSVNFVIDPNNDNILNTNDSIVAVLTDTLQGILNVEYFIDNILNNGEGINMIIDVPGADSVNAYIDFNIDNIEDGYHKLFVHGMDSSGVWGGFYLHRFLIDRNGPDISNVNIKYPNNRTSAKDSQYIYITAYINDAYSGVDTNKVYVNSIDINGDTMILMNDKGINGDLIANDKIFTAKVFVLTGGAVDSMYSFTINALDSVANISQLSGTIHIDNIEPVFISNLIPADEDNIYKNGDKITIVSKWDGVDYNINAYFGNVDSNYELGSEQITNNNDSTYTIVYTISTENTQNDTTNASIIISAYDDAGNGPIESYYSIELDNTEPAFYLIQSDKKSYTNGDSIFLSFSMDNADNTVFVDFSVIDSEFDSSSVNVSNTGINYVVRYRISDNNTTPDGSYSIKLLAEDIAGNTKTVFVSVELDNTPEPVSFIKPQTGTFLNSDVVIEVTAPDDASKVFFQISPDGGNNWYNINGTISPDTATVDSNGQDGWKVVWYTDMDSLEDTDNYLIRAYAYDENDVFIAYSITDWNITVDNTIPNLSFNVFPQPEGDSINGNVYVNKIDIKGVFFDLPDSNGVEKIIIESRNDNGDHIGSSPIIIPNVDNEFSYEISLSEGNNTIIVSAVDYVGNVDVDTVLITYIVPEVSAIIGYEGGTIESPNGTRLIIPEGAVLNDTRFSIKMIDESELMPSTSNDIELLKIAHKFEPDNIVFHKPVELILSYTDYDLDIDKDGEKDYFEDSLSVFFYDGNSWIKVNSATKDSINNELSLQINHLSIYDIGIDRRVLPSVFNHYLTQNPFKSGTGTTIVFSAPSAGVMNIRIYDLSGDLIANVVNNMNIAEKGEYSVKWNGLNQYDKFLGSGIYIYVLQFIANDGQTIVIRKPLGVIK